MQSNLKFSSRANKTNAVEAAGVRAAKGMLGIGSEFHAAICYLKNAKL